MSKSDDLRLGSLFTDSKNLNTHTKSIKIALIGYPNDEGVARNGGRIGAAAGPDIVRSMLKKKGCVTNEEYSSSLSDVEIKDFGNSSGDRDLKSVHKAHQDLVFKALSGGYLPIIVGGGNDQSFPNFLGLANYITSTDHSAKGKNLLVVNIDAHLDVRPLLAGEEPHSGSPFRQILEMDTDMSPHLVEFACQGNQCSSEHVKYVREKGGRIVWLKDLHGSILTNQVPECSVSDMFDKVLDGDNSSNTFVSFDIDGIRSGDCPGVSCPSPVGLTAEEAISICYKSGRCSHVRMMDISEFNPLVESYMTATLVANMIYYFIIGVVHRKRAEMQK